jgi:hypothetical protein
MKSTPSFASLRALRGYTALAVLGLLSSVLCHGAPVTLTRAQASDLFVALASAEPGLAPANTIAAADNINTLRPPVEALDKAKQSYQRALRALAKAQPADIEAQVDKLNAELEAAADKELKLDLAPLSLTDDELTAAKVKPAILAVIRRWLLKTDKK